MKQNNYYWMKLNRHFFQSPDIIYIMSLKDGADMMIFYFKLIMLAMNTNGTLRFSIKTPYTSSLLATVTQTPLHIVRACLRQFKKLGLIFVDTQKTIFICNMGDFIGGDAPHNEQKKKSRKHNSPCQEEDICVNRETEGYPPDDTSIYSHDEIPLPPPPPKEVTPYPSEQIADWQNYDFSPQPNFQPDSKTSDTVKPKKNKASRSTADQKDIDAIIDHLNKTAKTGYRPTSKTTVSCISARLNEGFSVEDFYTVIDDRVREWGQNDSMAMYLRPSTLFGNKFESYLNNAIRLQNTMSEYDMYY